MMIKAKNPITLIAKIYRLKIDQKNLNRNLNRSITYDVILSPQNLGDLSAPEVPCCLF